MIRLTLEPQPFHALGHRSAAGGGALPFFRGALRGLPALETGRALVAASDLQGREAQGPRLLGEATAETLAALEARGAIPKIGLCLLGGDLYADDEASRMGASGDVACVLNAFAALAPTAAVLGNHDRAEAAALDARIRLLDGDAARFGALTIGGVSGIIGRAGKPMRRPAPLYQDALAAAASQAHILLTHQGPDLPSRGEIGSAEIRDWLAWRGSGLHLFGHARWREPAAEIGAWTALNIEGRVFVLDVES